MFSGNKKKKAPKPKRGDGKRNLSQFGLMDVPNFDGEESGHHDDEDNEADLEDELHQLMYGSSKAKKAVPKKKVVPQKDLDLMVQAALKDLPSGDELSDVDEDDPELMAELEGFQVDEGIVEEEDDHDVVQVPDLKIIQPIEPVGNISEPCTERECAGTDFLSVIDSRISNYSQAEKYAKENNDLSRSRRYARGLNTLTELRRKVMTGKAISDEDIPPAVVFPISKNASPALTPQKELSSNDLVQKTEEVKLTHSETQDIGSDSNLNLLRQRREECKTFALKAKHEGDKLNALAGLQAVKECDSLITKLNSGEITVIDKLPEIIKPVEKQQPPSEDQKNPVNRQFSVDDPVKMPENGGDIPPPDPALFHAPPPPKTVEEALQQRLAKYREDEQKAKTEGNNSKVRRLGRICHQYTDAIKQHKAGKPIPVEDLPTPPGFGPIPVAQAVPSGAVGSTVSFPAAGPAASNPVTVSTVAGQTKPEAAKHKSSMSLRDKQIADLEKMKVQFREAALKAKQSGQMEQAKEYLRQMKGFDKVIEAANCGLPVDFKTLPVPPGKHTVASMGFEIVSREDCEPSSLPGGGHEVYSKLEADIIAQVKMCERSAVYFKATGDVASSNKFQQMMEHSKKDLIALRSAFKHGDPVPRFHYEVRSFSKIICNAELSDVDFEFSVVRGLSYGVPNPKEIHTYCRLDFPYPSKEAPFRDKTVVVKDTNSPQYDHKVIIPVNPKDKNYQRIFKRQSAKVEVWSKGGFLRSDTLIGTASIKLQPLETVCEIHDTFPLMDGRRAVGGKIEVQLRIRNPILTKQIEKVEEKWLVIKFN